jgi:hypothetical protein
MCKVSPQKLAQSALVPVRTACLIQWKRRWPCCITLGLFRHEICCSDVVCVNTSESSAAAKGPVQASHVLQNIQNSNPATTYMMIYTFVANWLETATAGFQSGTGAQCQHAWLAQHYVA